MGKLEKKFNAIIDMYQTVRDSEEILNSDYFELISYDIDGYRESFYEAQADGDTEEMECLIATLSKQVGNASKLLIAMKNINFIYG